MKAAIFGAGNAGKHLVNELLTHKEKYEIVAILDNMVSGEYKGIQIRKPLEFFAEKAGAQEIYLAAGAQKTLRMMMNLCLENGCKDVYMLHDIAGKNKLGVFDEKGELNPQYVRKIRFSEEKPTIHYFEVPITDNCNLNCKGCLFASNSVRGEKKAHVPLEQLRQDAERMRELFYDVPWIRILGGEPLMHPDIISVLRKYRELFPDTEIDLTTNGLLIPRMSEEFWQCVEQNRISIHVSGYEPTYKLLDKIDGTLKKNKMPYVILPRENFLKYYTQEGNHDKQESYDNCIACACYEVYRGRIAACSGTIAFEQFNRAFHAGYDVRENEDWFALDNPALDGWQIIKKLNQPLEICRYCDTKHAVSFPWEASKRDIKLEDYMV